jgi:hypothetical protein
MYQALFSTSETIRRFIEDRITGVASAGVLHASLNTPAEMRSNNTEGVSVWLYRIIRDPERLNDPPEQVGWNQIRIPPLPLRLHYLITPITGSQASPLGNPIDEQMLLGRVLQLFHSYSVLRGAHLQGQFVGTATELHIRLEPMSLEEITRVWEALDGSYQLSVSYEVSVVNIEAETEPESMTPVEVVLPEYGIIVGES